MSRHLFIDGDILVYRFAHSEQEVIQWDRDLFTFHAMLTPAKERFQHLVDSMMESTGADECDLILSDLDGNFKKDLCPEYKFNRAGVVRPILFSPLRKWLLEEFGAKFEPKLEGDDLLGILATDPCPEGARTFEPVIASIDKDLLTVPGMHFNWDGAEMCLHHVSPDEARYNHLIQTLMGDATDGYKGVPGVGPKKAAKLMDGADLDTAWEDVVVPAYQKAGLNERVALMYARVAYVLQAHNYDFETQTITHWEPVR